MPRLLLALAASVVALAAAPSGAGAVTVGVDLATVSPGNPYDCGGGTECTLAEAFALPTNEAEGGIYSTVNGTITSWQLKTGAGGASAVRLRVIHRHGFLVTPLSAQATGAGSSAMVNAPPFSVTSFPTSLPVRRADLIGLDCCGGANDSVNTPATSSYVWDFLGGGPLADGSSRFADRLSPQAGLMLNATIDVNDDLRIVSKPKLRSGKVRIQAELPNPGGVDLAAKGGLLRRSSGFYSEDGRQEISLALTNDGRSLLREGKRLKAKIKVAYTPIETTELIRRKVKAVVKR